MRQRSLAALMVGATMSVVACGGPSRTVTRESPDKMRDLSGKWNDTDARLTSEALIKDAFSRPWLTNFKAQQDRSPVVRVRRIVNKTDEHIDPQVFVKNIERAMVNSGEVQVLAQTGSELGSVNAEEDYAISGRVGSNAPSVGNQKGADFVLVGRVASVVDRWEGRQTKFYKTTFELIDATTGQKVWIGDHEIKKFIEQDRASW